MPTERHHTMVPVLALLATVSLLGACSPGVTAPSGQTTAPGAPSAPATGASSAPSAADPGLIRLEMVAADLDHPLDIVAADDGSGRIFVVEQPGRIQTVRDGVRDPTPFLDITDRVKSEGGEQGLLGLALHPDYPTDGRIFVDYTDLNGDTVVSSFTMSLDGDVVDPGSERIMLQVKQPFPNHNGGSLAFGPDRALYIGMGDGGSEVDSNGSANGQALDTLLGKILRIVVDPDPGSGLAYGIPEDNPYATGPDGTRPEIWASGMRNPWRFRFDDQTGDLWIGDVGEGTWEEIDVIRAGQGGLDFGWHIMEGLHCYIPDQGCDQTGLTLPVTEYGHDVGCAVVGGVVVHAETLPSIDGRYIFSDNCTGNVWLIGTGGSTPRNPSLILKSGRPISSIAQDANGVVYMTDLVAGELLRVEEAGS